MVRKDVVPCMSSPVTMWVLLNLVPGRSSARRQPVERSLRSHFFLGVNVLSVASGQTPSGQSRVHRAERVSGFGQIAQKLWKPLCAALIFPGLAFGHCVRSQENYSRRKRIPILFFFLVCFASLIMIDLVVLVGLFRDRYRSIFRRAKGCECGLLSNSSLSLLSVVATQLIVLLLSIMCRRW